MRNRLDLAIFGVLLGSGLFVGGFINHDVNYTGGPDYRIIDIDGDRYRVTPGSNGENRAFLVATAGAAILTVSLKHLWKQRRGAPKRPYGKFQLSRDMAAGFALWMVGINTHDYGREVNDGWVSRRNANGEWGPFQDLRYQEPERLGFAGGMLGSVWMSAAAKHYWDARRAGTPNRMLDQAYQDLRLQLLTQ